MKALKILCSIVTLSLLSSTLFAQEGPVQPTITGTGTYYGLTPPLRDLPVITEAEFLKMEADATYERNKDLKKRSYPFAKTALPKGPDPAWQREMGTTKGGKAPIMNFSGQISPYYPPDANGAAGPLYYMQTINCVYAIYDKATGSIEAGPTNMNQLFSGVTGSECNDGDPLVLFDEQANRWLAVEFSLCGNTDRMLVAVSQTSDPTGSWHKYSFDVDDMPDYEKFGVWQDGYYMGTNNGSGKDIYVFERSQMLNGGTARFVGFNNPWRPTTLDGIMTVPPVDNDGAFAPAGEPALFITINDDAIGGYSDQLWIYELDVDWLTLSNSTFNRVQQIDVPPFDSNFGNSWDNIRQPATSRKLDAIPSMIMNRPQYRNFGSYETIVCCHTVDLDATDHAGIRWYELRRNSGEWSIRQTGTYGPDQHSRWMGSVSMNGNNEIGLAYSVSSTSVYPGIRYCGQSSSEYAAGSGVLDIEEAVIQSGSYSQSVFNRWGDYADMSVDPDNDHTFWFTSEYIGSGDARLTKIASFEFSLEAPANLVAQLNDETGAVYLTWIHHGGPAFDHYNIYRGLTLIGTTVFPLYYDNLPDYGSYQYQVTAFYTIEGESAPAIAYVKWGNAQAQVAPEAIEAFVLPEENTSVIMGLSNVGQLPLEYTSSFSAPADASRDAKAYCSGLGGCGEFISNVAYGDVSNPSACNGYEDFSSLSYIVAKSGSIEITIQNGANIYPEDICGIWIDWNQNESFLDDPPVTVSGSPGPGPYTATITVPDDAKNGMTRLRIRIRRGGALSPCGLAPNGEVEDYSLNVLGWVTASPMQGTIQAGESQDITFNFDASGLGIGTYNAIYTISSNDPDGELIVPVTMHVAAVSVTVTADKDSLCFSGSTTLHANITGGSGTFTYSWTSDPPGFTSSEPNPVVAPMVTTTYFVEVSNGTVILQDEIIITVINLPEVDLGEDVSVCESGETVFDAGAGFATYLWSNGQTGQSITVTIPGTYWVEVANDFGCTKRDSVAFIINPLPVISLGADQNFCEGSFVTLTAGTGFISYLWNSGATSDYINASEPGEYWVEVTDANGCSNRDTIVLTMNPQPEVDLGADQTICQGTNVTFEAGNGFSSYLWNTGATGASIEAGEYGEYWVEVTDANNCSNRDTVFLTIDPLPVLAGIISGLSSVDNYLGLPSDYISSASTFATSYEWRLEPVEAGSISGTGLSAQVTWSSGFTGTALVSVRGVNECGVGPYSQNYPVAVYSSQGIGEKNAISGIKLFPNPNDGVFTLQLNSGKEQEIRLQISTSGGNQILESKENIPAGLYQKSFNLSTLPGGTYYLVISDIHGRMMSRLQVVVQ
jgi:hypothetical protein